VTSRAQSCSQSPLPLTEHVAAAAAEADATDTMGHVPIILCAPQRDIACEELLEADGVYGLVEFRCGRGGTAPTPHA